MFRHYGVLTLKDGATDQQRRAIVGGLQDLHGTIPGLTEVEVAEDLGLRDGNADILFTLSFESREAWEGYGDLEAHQRLIKEHIGPVLKSKVFLQAATVSRVGP